MKIMEQLGGFGLLALVPRGVHVSREINIG